MLYFIVLLAAIYCSIRAFKSFCGRTKSEPNLWKNQIINLDKIIEK